jgi:hypothetical protein
MEDTTNPIGGLVTNIQGSFESLWNGVLDILPNIVEGIVLLIVGWIVAIVISKVVGKVVEVIRLNDLLATAGVRGFFQKAGIKLNIDLIFEEVIKWFILIVFFISAANAFGLSQVNQFLSEVLAYIPNIIIAVVILIAGVLVANFLADLAAGAAKATKTGSPNVAGSVTRYAIIIFTVFAALEQLGIGGGLIDSFVNNLGMGLAFAFALAFGLGGKDTAADVIKKIRKDIK